MRSLNINYTLILLLFSLLSHVQLFATLWTVVCQTLLSMEFPRQGYRSVLPFPSSGYLPDQGIKPISPALAGRFFTTETPRKPLYLCCFCLVTQSCPTLCDPMDCSQPGSSAHGDSPGKNIGMGCHFLLQRIFRTQGSHPYLLHWQADSLPSEPPGEPHK